MATTKKRARNVARRAARAAAAQRTRRTKIRQTQWTERVKARGLRRASVVQSKSAGGAYTPESMRAKSDAATGVARSVAETTASITGAITGTGGATDVIGGLMAGDDPSPGLGDVLDAITGGGGSYGEPVDVRNPGASTRDAGGGGGGGGGGGIIAAGLALVGLLAFRR